MISKGVKDPSILDRIRIKGITRVWQNFKYFFRRKNAQFKRLRKWVPIIWNQYDFDYRYAIEMFSAKLEDIATLMESDRAKSVESAHCATRIRTAIRLMKKVYDEEYACEYQTKLDELYGRELMEIVFVPVKNDEDHELAEKYKGCSYMRHQYDLTETPKRIAEIEEMSSKLHMESRLKQEKAHRILWAFIEHNIRHWWD